MGAALGFIDSELTENTNSLGTYLQVSLQIARTKLAEAKQHVVKGDNPSTANRIAKANQIIKGDATFGAIARDWLAHNQSEWSAHHYERNEGLLRRYLLPDLERLPIDAIKEAYLYKSAVLALRDDLLKLGRSGDTVNHYFNTLSKLFQMLVDEWGLALANPNKRD